MLRLRTTDLNEELLHWLPLRFGAASSRCLLFATVSPCTKLSYGNGFCSGVISLVKCLLGHPGEGV